MSDFESRLSIDKINIFLVQLDDMRMSGTLVDIFHKLLEYIILALSFTFNLEEIRIGIGTKRL